MVHLQSITGVGFSPDLVWLKQEIQQEYHALFDTVRGATKQIIIKSNCCRKSTQARC
jgi:hypothetical protein